MAKPKRYCVIDECGRPVKGHGLCEKHYSRQRRRGSTHDISATTEDLFWTKVDKMGPMSRLGTRCWAWTAGLTTAGYGQFWANGAKTVAHKFAYQAIVGMVPAGMQLDHVCHNVSCVNPDHLRIVTPKQNRENHSGLTSNNTSGIRGVSWNRVSKRWQAKVGHNGRTIACGTFLSASEAEAAVIKKRLELFTHNDLDQAS